MENWHGSHDGTLVPINADIVIEVAGSGVGTLQRRGEIRQRVFAAMTQSERTETMKTFQ